MADPSELAAGLSAYDPNQGTALDPTQRSRLVNALMGAPAAMPVGDSYVPQQDNSNSIAGYLAEKLAAVRQTIDPSRVVSPTDVASFLPGGGLANAWNDSGRGWQSLKSGDYAGAAANYGNMALNLIPEGGAAAAKLAAVFGPGTYRVYKGHVPHTGGDVKDWKGNVLETSPEVPITEFRRPGDEVNAGFFSSSPDVANRFAGISDRSAVFSGDLTTNTPKIFDATGQNAANFQFQGHGLGTPEQVQAFREAMANPSHDAVVLSNTLDEGDVFVPKAFNQPVPNWLRKP